MATAASKAIQNDHKRLLRNLRLIQKNHSVSELADLIGVSQTTWFNRMKQPWKAFSYDDFKAISGYCKIDFETLLTGELSIK